MSKRVPSPVAMPCDVQSEFNVQPQLEQANASVDEIKAKVASDAAARWFLIRKDMIFVPNIKL
jgi:hypothetical protein